MTQAEDTKDYIDKCTKMKNIIKTNHEYYVQISYQKNGLIDYIRIVDVGDEETDAWHRLY